MNISQSETSLVYFLASNSTSWVKYFVERFVTENCLDFWLLKEAPNP